MKGHTKRILDISAVILYLLSLSVLGALPAGAQQAPEVLRNAVANSPVAFDTSPPIRDLPVEAPAPGARRVIPVLPTKPLRPSVRSAVASNPGPLISAILGLNFDGVGQNATNNCPDVSGVTVAPPDTNLAVGDTQVVQWVNLCYAVFDKSTGAVIAGPFPGNQFWAGFGGTCETSNSGDPIIQWDKANHVWVASQNVFSRPYLTCIAVSTTDDATGSYHRYAFSQPGFPDYPKWGLTPSVYYPERLWPRGSTLRRCKRLRL
jgi:hypothetical protein